MIVIRVRDFGTLVVLGPIFGRIENEERYGLLTDPELASRMGRANRDWAETLTWERYAQEQYQVYEKILA